METAPLKSFATWARTALIREVTARITAVLAPGSPERIEQARAIAALEKAVAGAGGGDKGRSAIADTVAYTWFNRIIALRFMDANGYTGVGVVSPPTGIDVGQPEILADAKRGVIDPEAVSPSVSARVTRLLDGSLPSGDPQGEAYALLLEAHCNHWHKAMPFMFQREGDYTELLIPTNLLADGSVLAGAVQVLTEDVCKDVEVIGWLYQFYISERKDEVFAELKKGKKAGAAEIPAATQLFTPDWIVRYLLENSLGRLWMLAHPSSRLTEHMDYYIPPVGDEAGCTNSASPEDLKIIDPACGSGHMLTYAFDLLYWIYLEHGYSPSEIPEKILRHNLYGTEIDQRAGSLAAFALSMKAREKQRTFFKRGVAPNICVLSSLVFDSDELDFLVTKSGDTYEEREFWNQFAYADAQGSLIQVPTHLVERLSIHLGGLDAQGDLYTSAILERARRVMDQAHYLLPRYDVAVANPPYMGGGSLDVSMAAFAKRHYSLAKADLYAMFIERCLSLAVATGTVAMVTQDSWMFLGTYAKYRERLLGAGSLLTLAHLGTAAFETIGGEVVSTVAFTINGAPLGEAQTVFTRATGGVASAKAEVLRTTSHGDEMDRVWVRSVRDFLEVPNTPLIYWATTEEITALREGPYLSDFIQAREGLTTGSNDIFLRRWYEISIGRIGFDLASTEDSVKSAKRWFPYQKGGPARRWYGNFDFVVDWENDGDLQKKNIDPATNRIRSHNYNGAYGFRRGFTWSGISGDGFAVRHVDSGFMFDAKGPMAFANRDVELLVIEGFLNSATATRFMRLLAPRLDFKIGHVLSLPIRITESERVTSLVERCIDLAQEEWDSSELSSGFAGSPLLGKTADLSEAIEDWLRVVDEARTALAQVEGELDQLFGEEYGLSGHEVDRTPTVVARSIRTQGIVDDLVSFAVGCMFGRYSLTERGLILAEQGSTLQDYLRRDPSPTLSPDADNVIPIVEGDWFEDDIVERFRQFMRAAFGEEHFEENLRFVTESLGVKSLREYFLKFFYKDHVQRYKKRPIYWLFSSPNGSFNALIYMHRYTPSTVSTVLNEYLREFQAKLRASLEHAERSNSAKEADRLRKMLLELDQYEHDVLYPLASQNIAIDLDDGVKANYPKFGTALKKIVGLEAGE